MGICPTQHGGKIQAMQTKDVLIINTELFLQCFGSCSGCFLTDEERGGYYFYDHIVRDGLEKMAQKYKDVHVKKLVIGFGRGNTLNASQEDLEKLLSLMDFCNRHFSFDTVHYEVSTSMIGKLEQQKEKAAFLLDRERRIFFNIVLNSELQSSSFWRNVRKFYDHNEQLREKWGIVDETGDILVFNVNPQKLPDINMLKKYFGDVKSAFNISLFPFDSDVKKISLEQIRTLNEWANKMYEAFRGYDLNIKNFLTGYYHYAKYIKNINDVIHYNKITKGSYVFIDKRGVITDGSLSIMGEVDKIRLMDKFGLELNEVKAYRKMNKSKICSSCEHQTTCLVSGAYLGMLSNLDRLESVDNIDINGVSNIQSYCPNGYAGLFSAVMHDIDNA